MLKHASDARVTDNRLAEVCIAPVALFARGRQLFLVSAYRNELGLPPEY